MSNTTDPAFSSSSGISSTVDPNVSNPSTLPPTASSSSSEPSSLTEPNSSQPVTSSSSSSSSSSSQEPPPPSSSSPSPSPTPSSSSSPPPSSTRSSESPTPVSSSSSPSSSSVPETSESPSPTGPVVIVTPSNTATSIEVVTSFTTQQPDSSASSSTRLSASSTPTPIDPAGDANGGLSQGSKVAIGVVVPIAAIALLAVVGLYWWKKRRARQEAEEERRKEVEDYAYNPNADPSVPPAGLAADSSYEMKEDGSGGYRGWGSTTVAGSAGRKTSTRSGGHTAGAMSDVASGGRGAASEARSGDALLDGSDSPEGEILGAMGPSASMNRTPDVRRGPSNASSYSAAAPSDGSDGGLYGNGTAAAYFEHQSQNPYLESSPQKAHELAGQPVIRNNPARRNTRIENPAYPAQSAGIAQNF